MLNQNHSHTTNELQKEFDKAKKRAWASIKKDNRCPKTTY